MNGPPIPPAPDEFDADEALNALVDGELGAFAEEQGLDEATVRAQLVATPDFAAQRAALEQARAAVGAPVPPLDDVTRRRLVGNATNAAPKPVPGAPRSRRWVAVTAIAAAGLLVLAGIGVAVSSIGNNSSSSNESASSSGTAPLHGDVGKLGDVTSPAALRALLDRRAAGDTTTTTPASAQSQFAAGGPASDALNVAPAPTAKSTAACARQLAGHRTVAFTGTGSYQGAPVTIVGITTRGRTIVFVVSDTDCTDVVASISR